MKKIIFILFAYSLLTSCGPKGNGIDLIPSGNRASASEIQADFLNLSSPNPTMTPTPLPGKIGRKVLKGRQPKVQEPALTMTLEKLKGKVVVLDFWATWCGPCRMEIPSLVKIYSAYHSKGLEVIGLSVELNDGQSKDYFRQFISQYQINYPVGLSSVETLKSYGINPIPATFFIDKAGKVALSFVGVHPEEDFTGAIEKLLAE